MKNIQLMSSKFELWCDLDACSMGHTW